MGKGNINEAIEHFQYMGELISIEPYGNGHINDTYLLTFCIGEIGKLHVILQKMNINVFKEPLKLIENIQGVTTHLRKKVIEKGGDPDRECLKLIPAIDGNLYFLDSEGEYWRSYQFITDSSAYDKAESAEDFYQSAIAFGTFQCLLTDYPTHTLYETIPGFHDTRARYKVFNSAVSADICQRAAHVQKEIEFVRQHEHIIRCFGELQDNGQLPLRVTHNDTKLNNVMIDHKTRKGICVIDLDTVMPGLVMNDFGDSIRFGANTAAEDEKDLSKVSFDITMFDAYAKGFLESCGDSLTEQEVRLLPMGALTMTLECGMRFLTDYLQGDIYFKTHREDHNLDRCRTQFKLVEDMENQWEQMNSIVLKYCK